MVQSGDSLYTIARQFGLSAEELARINNISTDQPLQVGLRLYIPEPKEKPPITSIGYIQPTGSTVSQTLIHSSTNNTLYLTYLETFYYESNRSGCFNPKFLNSLYNDAKNTIE